MRTCDEHQGFAEVLGGIARDISKIEKNIENINISLNGNGKRGLKSRVAVLEWMIGTIGTGTFIVIGYLFEKGIL